MKSPTFPLKSRVCTQMRAIHISTQILYKSAKRPYTSTKEIYVSGKKLSLYPQKGPRYLYLKHVTFRAGTLTMRHPFTHKRARYTRKRALHIRKRALYARKRALYISKALYIRKKALYISKRALYICLWNTLLTEQEHWIWNMNWLTYTSTNEPCTYTLTKEPCASTKEPYISIPEIQYIKSRNIDYEKSIHPHKKEPYTHTTEPYISVPEIEKKVNWIRKKIRAGTLTMRHRFTHSRALHVYIHKSALYIHQRSLYICKRALYIHKRALYIHTKSPIWCFFCGYTGFWNDSKIFKNWKCLHAGQGRRVREIQVCYWRSVHAPKETYTSAKEPNTSTKEPCISTQDVEYERFKFGMKVAVYDMIHSRVWHSNLLLEVAVCDMIHSRVWHDSFPGGGKWRVHMCVMTYSYLWHSNVLLEVAWDIIDSRVWHDSFFVVKWRIHMRDVAYLQVW